MIEVVTCVDSFVKYHSLLTLFDYYTGGGVALNLAIQFGRTVRQEILTKRNVDEFDESV